MAGDVVTNDGNSALIIEAFALVDADNLERVGSYLVPIDGNDDVVIRSSSTKPEEP